MAYKFNEKRNTKQQEITYILFMILGSYFEHCICRSKETEKTLFLYFQEMSSQKQITSETKIINAAEKILKPFIPLFEDSLAEVSITKTADRHYHLSFTTGFETVEADIDPAGQYDVRVRR